MFWYILLCRGLFTILLSELLSICSQDREQKFSVVLVKHISYFSEQKVCHADGKLIVRKAGADKDVDEAAEALTKLRAAPSPSNHSEPVSIQSRGFREEINRVARLPDQGAGPMPKLQGDCLASPYSQNL